MQMRKIITILMFLGLPTLGAASSDTVHLDQPTINLKDMASLQRGARVFIENCLNCHSAGYMRYARMASDLGMSEDDTRALMYTSDKLGELMNVSIDEAEAKVWFGTAPPDLSVITRSRKPAWIYTYLRSFYADTKRPFGVNNTVFKDVAMPHVLAPYQGVQKAVYAEGHNGDKKVKKLLPDQPGSMNTAEFDAMINDLVNFMVYVGEPAKLVRYNIGIYVLVFIVLLASLLYMLKREYWKDVH